MPGEGCGSIVTGFGLHQSGFVSRRGQGLLGRFLSADLNLADLLLESCLDGTQDWLQAHPSLLTTGSWRLLQNRE